MKAFFNTQAHYRPRHASRQIALAESGTTTFSVARNKTKASPTMTNAVPFSE
jgi:hypothetical protein